MRTGLSIGSWGGSKAGTLYRDDVGEEIDVGIDGRRHDVTQCYAAEEGLQEHSHDDGTERNAEDPGGSEAASCEEEGTADDHEAGEDVSPQHAERGERAKAHGNEAAKFLNSPVVSKADE